MLGHGGVARKVARWNLAKGEEHALAEGGEVGCSDEVFEVRVDRIVGFRWRSGIRCRRSCGARRGMLISNFLGRRQEQRALDVPSFLARRAPILRAVIRRRSFALSLSFAVRSRRRWLLLLATQLQALRVQDREAFLALGDGGAESDASFQLLGRHGFDRGRFYLVHPGRVSTDDGVEDDAAEAVVNVHRPGVLNGGLGNGQRWQNLAIHALPLTTQRLQFLLTHASRDLLAKHVPWARSDFGMTSRVPVLR